MPAVSTPKTLPFVIGDSYLFTYSDADKLISIRVARYDGGSKWLDWGVNKKRSFLPKRIQVWSKMGSKEIIKAINKFYELGDPIYSKAV